jgi:antitoxin CptB
MTGSSRSSDGLDPRRRRTLFRAWRRGTREMDLLLGGFADMHINELSDGDLTDFEALMDVPEGDLYGWLTGRQPVPGNYGTPIYQAILAFHSNDATHEQS